MTTGDQNDPKKKDMDFVGALDGNEVLGKSGRGPSHEELMEMANKAMEKYPDKLKDLSVEQVYETIKQSHAITRIGSILSSTVAPLNIIYSSQTIVSALMFSACQLSVACKLDSAPDEQAILTLQNMILELYAGARVQADYADALEARAKAEATENERKKNNGDRSKH